MDESQGVKRKRTIEESGGASPLQDPSLKLESDDDAESDDGIVADADREQTSESKGIHVPPNASAPLVSGPKKWSLEGDSDGDEGGDEGGDDDGFEEEDDDDMAPPPPVRSMASESSPRAKPAIVDADADPLEAFMFELDATEDIVAQESVNDLSSRGMTPMPQQPQPSSNTISLEDILKMSTSSYTGEDQGGEGWESDARSEMTDDEGDSEAAHERDRHEFLKAVRSMQGTGGGAEARAGASAESSSGQGAADGDTIAAVSEAATLPSSKEGKGKVATLGRMFSDDGDVMEEHEREDQERNALELLQEAIKKKELAPVDHAQVDYVKVRKNLYIVPRALAPLAQPANAAKLADRREALGIKVRGKGCPPPVETWEHCGLPDKVLAQLRKVYGTESAPFAIQQQAVPTIMSGRDVIGIAKTGSGKTLAFLLPMIRHILDQPPLGECEGPIGLILAPARELAVQIFNEAKKFTKALNMRVTAVYGGASVADQIGELKRGAEIVVCTPGRMIDILTMQAGKLISLARVSFVVLDEADRMFDLGFEPQIRMVLQNIRPDRQTVLFSATFPQKVEDLARKVLTVPVEIVVGGRSVANTAITQFAEVREEGDKFMRLLQLLGVWFERGHVLIFTDTQARCERLFEDLMRAGYPCLSLHGGKEQVDRDDSIASYKNKLRTLMVATSVAGRGLDVPDLCCVINYSCPNHLEDYVHRVGRTGRGGRSGTAYTFISPEEEQYAPILVKALRQSEQAIPDELQTMADSFMKKIGAGHAKWASSGFGGSGFKFDPSEMSKSQKMVDMQRRQYEVDNGLRDPADFFSDDEDEEDDDAATAAAAKAAAMQAAGSASSSSSMVVFPSASETPLERAKRLATQLAGGNALVAHAGPPLAVQQALAQAKKLAEKLNGSKPGESKTHFSDEFVINDYPQKARWKITHRETIDDVSEKFGVAIKTCGSYVAPGKKPGPSDKKLYLHIEGHTEIMVSGARREISRILNEETMRVGLDPSTRYSVV